MINFKKMDDKDFVFVNQPLNAEEKEFSDFLKARKSRSKPLRSTKKVKINIEQNLSAQSK